MAVGNQLGWSVLGVAVFGAAMAGVVAPLAAERAAAGPGARREVTFTKDIAPILQRSCQNCHRPGRWRPMSLITYEEVRPWARAIKQRTGIGATRPA